MMTLQGARHKGAVVPTSMKRKDVGMTLFWFCVTVLEYGDSLDKALIA